jgi:hypothetical protein
MFPKKCSRLRFLFRQQPGDWKFDLGLIVPRTVFRNLTECGLAADQQQGNTSQHHLTTSSAC